MKRSGLTLFELIVVTVIILIVAAIVTGVTIRSVANAKKTSCLSSLRNLGLSLHAYAADHDDRLPPYFWVNVGYGEDPGAFKKALSSYGMTEALWFCPLDQHAHTDYPGQYGDHMASSYATNIGWLLKGNQGGVWSLQLTGVPHPSQTHWFFDQGQVVKDDDGKWIYVGNHGSDGNSLFFDGHVKKSVDPMAEEVPPTN